MTTPFDSTSTPNPSAGQYASQVISPKVDQQPETSQVPRFPSPQTFTFLPQLYTLISHLAPLQTQPQGNGTPVALRPSRSPTLARRPAPLSSTAGTDLHTTTVDGTASLTLTQTRSREEITEIKDLPTLVYPLRQQIETAKEVVRQLPDVDRTISEQEDEIRILEAKIKNLDDRLKTLSVLAVVSGRGGYQEHVMEQDVAIQGVTNQD